MNFCRKRSLRFGQWVSRRVASSATTRSLTWSPSTCWRCLVTRTCSRWPSSPNSWRYDTSTRRVGWQGDTITVHLIRIRNTTKYQKIFIEKRTSSLCHTNVLFRLILKSFFLKMQCKKWNYYVKLGNTCNRNAARCIICFVLMWKERTLNNFFS